MPHENTRYGWAQLNDEITKITSIQLLEEWLEDEIAGPCRRKHVFRIHSRLNKVRADQERAAIEKRLKEKGV